MESFTDFQYCETVIIYTQEYAVHFLGETHPSAVTIVNTVWQLREIGSITSHLHSGRPVSAGVHITPVSILAYRPAHPHCSTRYISMAYVLTRGQVWQILNNQHALFSKNCCHGTMSIDLIGATRH